MFIPIAIETVGSWNQQAIYRMQSRISADEFPLLLRIKSNHAVIISSEFQLKYNRLENLALGKF